MFFNYTLLASLPRFQVKTGINLFLREFKVILKFSFGKTVHSPASTAQSHQLKLQPQR